MKKPMLLIVLLIVLALGVNGCSSTSKTIAAGTEAVSEIQITETATTSPEFTGYYTLHTMFLEKDNKCLEGNRMADDALLMGAAFMNDCVSPSTGQLWKIVPADDGYYTLQTLFLEKENKCLEGNRLADDAVLKGAAFMNDCANPSTGQLWKLKSADDGYYTLQTMFLEKENKCLEGNRLADDAVMSGAAFMNDCVSPSTGQLWKLLPAE